MLRVIRTFGLALGVLGGAVAAQGPEYAQQYAQRLGGAVDELRRAVATLDGDAQATGQSRDAALERLRRNSDALVARRGEAARYDIERLRALEAQQTALNEAASPLGRLLVVMRSPDMGLARAAYRDYQPAVPTTADGLIAGLVGFLATWAGWRLLADAGRLLGRRSSWRVRRGTETTPV
ncbi:DUF2937 family protein [Methylobacterium organophilum]|uniref:DUF2937 family protein n=1 Tax=Methylobacterium organophilum TaxID=410 RepID=UPI001F12FE1C|nr:DUF2937 family protein [Methylobacterium organophilum]UMY17776.1 DUF2937 family protein [Methylobacterium organophilum]